MNKPRKNMAESILARAELYRRGMLFEGVPSFSTADLELPAGPAAAAPGAPPAQAADSQALPAPVPGATDPLVAGAVDGKSPLQSMVGTP